MDLTAILSALLNPNGQQQSILGPATAVGDHNNPALMQQPMQQPMARPPMAPPMTPPAMPQPAQQPQGMPQAPQQQAMPPRAPMASPAPQGGGLGGFLEGLIAPNRAARNKTAVWLKGQGMDEVTASAVASDPQLLRSVMVQRMQGQKLSDFDQRARAAQQYGMQEGTPEFKNFVLTGDLPKPEEAKQTSDMQEYNLAVQQGFKGTFFDYQVKMKEAGRSQVNVDTGEKLPAGYRWVNVADQTKGVEPIPGGPATQLPSEAAGRIGLADTFLQTFDDTKKKVLNGDVTGPWDAAVSRNNSSSPGADTYRQIQSGVDALTRMLTGAGQNVDEAKAYAARYLPTYTDDAESAAGKLDRLKREIEGAKATVMRGHGGSDTSAPTPAAAAPPVLDDTPPPPSYTGKNWKYMSAKDRALWQQ